MTNKEEQPVLYVILNGELEMSPGKGAAQAVHAAMLLEGNYAGLFVSGYKRTVVVLEAQNGETIKNLLEYLQGAGIFAAYYIDEVSEKKQPYQVTALAVEPIAHDDEEKRSIFADFPLFQGHVTVKREGRFGETLDRVKIKNGTRLEESFWFFRRLKKGVK